jgi:sugar-specific transcriptional regulator TrmB
MNEPPLEAAREARGMHLCMGAVAYGKPASAGRMVGTMSDRTNQERSVELLQQLGLKEYEARCFVALSRLPSGTAKQISEISDVPRTRIYDAIRVLEAKGLVEVQHSSPKRFRAVSVDEAAETLREDFASRTDRLLDELRDLEPAPLEDDVEATHEVWGLSGRIAIENRVDELLQEAEDEVVLVVGLRGALTSDVFDRLRDKRDAGLDVVVGTVDESLREDVQEELPDVQTFVSGLEWLDEAPGVDDDVVLSRLLLVDRRSILVSTLHEATAGPEGVEKAIFGTGFTNGLVVVARRLMATGLQEALDPGHSE